MRPAPHDLGQIAAAALRSWGVRGIGRRARYELLRRSGRLAHLEARWLVRLPRHPSIQPVPLTPQQTRLTGAERDEPVRLYGSLVLDATVPPGWHRHPLTGRLYEPSAHWTSFTDADPAAGDIKDLWELGRFGWLMPAVRRWANSRSDEDADLLWRALDSWAESNPPYRGPHWMCGQETALRGITVLFLASCLESSGATTPERRTSAARLVHTSVGRVLPTLGYALSQRNNHALSEVGFLWTAAMLSPNLPDAPTIRRRAARALTEAVQDQFLADGSYAQHSPSYHRLALHVLLWCLHVARSTGESPPAGVEAAVRRSVPFLRSILVPSSDGRMPNLGGNDGAALFALTDAPITDYRPVIAHAAAATGQASGLGLGTWDDEARWFGLEPVSEPQLPVPAAVHTHGLTSGAAHAVLRAGPLAHRPSHADQLHVDIWLDGEPVAVDPGSYRYTAPSPWANALAHEAVHNLPRVEKAPQAQRRGRFFWQHWTEAVVTAHSSTAAGRAIAATLTPTPSVRIHRSVIVDDGTVIVVDQANTRFTVRWNLPAGVGVDAAPGVTGCSGNRWSAHLVHEGQARLLSPSEHDPRSGWQSIHYGHRSPTTSLEIAGSSEVPVVSCFAASSTRRNPRDLVEAVASLAPDGGVAALQDLLERAQMR